MKEKQLAIDATLKNQKEALRYSKLIQDFFGIKTFSLTALKEAIDELPMDETLYLYQEYKLDVEDIDDGFIEFPKNICQTTENLLYKLNKKFQFLTETKIEHLQKLNDKVLTSFEYASEYDQQIQDATLSSRVRNALTRNGIQTVGDLINSRPKDLKRIRNLGPKSLEEIEHYIDTILSD